METSSRNDRPMPVPYFKIKYLQCQKIIAGPLVAIGGLLLSIWTNCILVVICYQDSNIHTLDQLIIRSGQYSHMLIVVSVTTAMYWGLKKNDRELLKPWIFTKNAEGIVLFVVTIIIEINQLSYVGLMLGIICLMLNGYLVLSMWDTYKKMPEELPGAPAPTIPNPMSMKLPGKPLRYDSYYLPLM